MPITGATQLAAVIGWPVEHSRSPSIHNAAAQAAGVDLVYTALPVRPGQGAAAAAAMRTLGLRGMSVTMPHKVDVMAALDEITPVAEALGAVNHITNTDGHLVGNNTDGAGFVAGLAHEAEIDLADKHVAVLGSGSAARAIIHACVQSGASVSVVARDVERGTSAAGVGGSMASTASADVFSDADVVVNATPLGMAGTESASTSAIDVSLLADRTVVVDIVYNPLETVMLTQAKERGLTTVDGLAMLVGQAMEQFETWTGVAASFDVMRSAARQ